MSNPQIPEVWLIAVNQYWKQCQSREWMLLVRFKSNFPVSLLSKYSPVRFFTTTSVIFNAIVRFFVRVMLIREPQIPISTLFSIYSWKCYSHEELDGDGGLQSSSGTLGFCSPSSLTFTWTSGYRSSSSCEKHTSSWSSYSSLVCFGPDTLIWSGSTSIPGSSYFYSYSKPG